MKCLFQPQMFNFENHIFVDSWLLDMWAFRTIYSRIGIINQAGAAFMNVLRKRRTLGLPLAAAA